MEEMKRIRLPRGIAAGTCLLILLVGCSVFHTVFFSPALFRRDTANVCGPTVDSWQSEFLKVQQEVLEGKRQKAIVWVCHKQCGGLGDRVRGMMLMMYTAALTGRGFFIWQTNPVKWEEAFLPSQQFMWHTKTISPSICDWSDNFGGGHACNRQLAEMHVRNDAGEVVSPFEARFGRVEDLLTKNNNINDQNTKRSLEMALDKLRSDEPVLFVRSNRPVALEHSFIPRLSNYLRDHKLQSWSSKSKQAKVERALGKIVDQDAVGCGMKFLFTPTPGLRATVEGLISRSFRIEHAAAAANDSNANIGDINGDINIYKSINDNIYKNIKNIIDNIYKNINNNLGGISSPPPIPPLLPYESFSSIPSSEGLAGRSPSKTFVDHLHEQGLILTTKATGRHVSKMIGVHLRLIPAKGPDRSFGDSTKPRIKPDESVLSIGCAKQLATALGWDLNSVVFFVVSDSLFVRKKFPELFGDLVATDPEPVIQHVDKTPKARSKRSRNSSSSGNNSRRLRFGEQQFRTAEEVKDLTEGYLAAWADLLLLAHSDAIVLSRSGFGLSARSMGLVPKEAVWQFIREKRGGELQCIAERLYWVDLPKR
eukprot:GHVS01066178.1.p1 GENE.GHVS01066178.1~~GHVS01066178.1.p1  ORF type:complete len:594 (-),score=87.89 GHVS01066178.1:184-1965(-)